MLELLNAPTVLIFLGTSGLLFLLFLFFEGGSGRGAGWGLFGRRRKEGPRMGDLALSALPRLGTPLMPSDEMEQTRLLQRLIHAGLYSRTAMPRFLGIRVVLLVGAIVVAGVLGVSRLFPPLPAMVVTCVLLGVALILPGLWLDWRKRGRQRIFRQALPDVIDTVTICLEGGLSLPESIRRVTEELQTVHPLLAEEFSIIQREMLLGLSPGETLRKFAARCDLPEVRDLAGVILHAERYGVSIVQAMRTEADAMRLERQQRAEEIAHKAAVKVLFPTLLLIFPAIFIVLLGPAVYSILKTFGQMK